MESAKNDSNIIQLRLPGMRTHRSAPASANCCSVHVGQQVVYMGSISGGPRFGSSGVVTEALQRKAVVDMGESGIWNIPYHFLTLPQAA
ncbi:MAG: hypothetical protein OXD31_04760 [Chloroflexi bacterium]|nr:hypothetical protein [Chloroflexota bacterium]